MLPGLERPIGLRLDSSLDRPGRCQIPQDWDITKPSLVVHSNHSLTNSNGKHSHRIYFRARGDTRAKAEIPRRKERLRETLRQTPGGESYLGVRTIFFGSELECLLPCAQRSGLCRFGGGFDGSSRVLRSKTTGRSLRRHQLRSVQRAEYMHREYSANTFKQEHERRYRIRRDVHDVCSRRQCYKHCPGLSPKQSLPQLTTFSFIHPRWMDAQTSHVFPQPR